MTDGGFFLVLEGIDGSGTTTQAAMLADYARASGLEVVLTREPTDGPVGRLLRQALSKDLVDGSGDEVRLDWKAMALLFSADRMDHLHREVLPALARGAVVISDRYYLSSLIYQSATSPEGSDALPWLFALNSRAQRPDLTLVLDVDPAVAAARRALRSAEQELFELSELQCRLAQQYRLAPSMVEGDRIVCLSGEGNQAEVAERIRKELALVPEFAWMGSTAP